MNNHRLINLVNLKAMKKISKVYLKNGRNAEYYLLCQNMTATITEEFATNYSILHVYQPYVDLVGKVAETYLQNQQFADTKGINEADAMSDSYMSMFKSMLNGYKLWPEAEKQEAYVTIYSIAKPYWGASSKPIAENIAMVKDLVVALRTDEKAKAAVTLLGLDPIVNKLEEANNECNRRYLMRADERLQRSLADKMKELRGQTDEAFYLLAEVISSLYVVYSTALKDEAKAAELEGLIDKVNAILLEYTVPISRRGGSKANVDPGTTPPGTSTGGGEEERPGEL